MPATRRTGSVDNQEGRSLLVLHALEASKANVSRVGLEKF